MGNNETAEREFAQALVKELQELHTRNYLREIGIVPTQILFAAKHTIEELLRQVAVLETEAALREPAPQPQAALLTNPYTGTPRDYRDVESDPAGVLIQEPGAPLAAAPQPQAEPVAWGVADKTGTLWVWDVGVASIFKDSAAGYVEWANEYKKENAPFSLVSFYAAPQPQPQPQASAEDDTADFVREASRLLLGFMLDTNAIGPHGAGENLVRGIKASQRIRASLGVGK